MAASLEGPLLRPNGRRDNDDRDWEKVTPLNSVISLESKITSPPSRQEQQSRMRNISKGIEAPLKSSPSKTRNLATISPEISRDLQSDLRHSQTDMRHSQADMRHSQTDMRHSQTDMRHSHTDMRHDHIDTPHIRAEGSLGHATGLPSPSVSDEIEGVSSLPRSQDHASLSLAQSDSTLRQVAPRLPSPVSRDHAPSQSTGFSRESSSVLNESEVSKSALFQTTRGDASSFIRVEKTALLRVLEKAERLQTLVDGYEDREKSRQADLVNQSITAVNTAQNAQSLVLPVPVERTVQSVAPVMWRLLRTILLGFLLLLVLTSTFEYGRVQAAKRNYLKPSPPLLASLTSMYDTTQVQRTIRYMSLRRPEIGYYPVEWLSWGVEALDFFWNGPYY